MKQRIGLNGVVTRWVRMGAMSLMMVPVMGAGEVVELDPFGVFGEAGDLSFSPGSGYQVGMEEKSGHSWDNIDQVIRRVPGVYFRTEDGYGLFPNVSFRGVGSMRTSQLTVMEDGILMAPAPYANPSAYYTPTTGRMRGMEILKGSSQVKYGPRTTGGVLNYQSTAIPGSAGGKITLTMGDNRDWRLHGWYGGWWEAAGGELGVLVEYYHRETDGFKRIDGAAGEDGGGTGFDKGEPMLKLAYRTTGVRKQLFELKLGRSDMDADETYLGLNSADFAEDPFRRYTATRFDRIETEHWRGYLRHSIEFSADTRLLSTLYYNEFTRSWYKLHDVRRIGGGAANLSAALAGAPFYEGEEAIAGTEGEPLAVLRGEAAGIWRVRDNNRVYKSYGVEAILQHRMEGESIGQAWEFGIRLHEDYEDRFQKQDDYTVDTSGQVTDVVIREYGTQDNRRGTARAVALYAKNTISWRAMTVVPGIRYEQIDYTDERRGMNPAAADFNEVIRKSTGSLDVVAPGIGATYALGEGWVAFGGVHRGFSLPSPGAVVSTGNPIKEETSTGYELGARFDRNGGLRAELALFWTDFNDLIVPDSIGGAGSGVTTNGGDVRTRGLEVAASFDPGALHNWGFRNPWSIAYTFTDATIRSDAQTVDAESIFAGARRGNALPYIPRHQISIGMSMDFDRFGLMVDAFYIDATYATANNSAEEFNPVGGPGLTPVPDARFGKNDAYFLMDVSLYYLILPDLRLNMGVQNLLDRHYVASRLPHGPRPGHPRFVHAGLTWEF